MSLLDDWKQIPSQDRHVRQFCRLLGVLSAVVAAWQLWKGAPEFAAVFAGAALYLAAGLAWPALARPAQIAWMSLAVALGWLMTRVILLVLFALVVTPIGFLRRLTRSRAGAAGPPSTYWRDRSGVSGTHETQY